MTNANVEKRKTKRKRKKHTPKNHTLKLTKLTYHSRSRLVWQTANSTQSPAGDRCSVGRNVARQRPNMDRVQRPTVPDRLRHVVHLSPGHLRDSGYFGVDYLSE